MSFPSRALLALSSILFVSALVVQSVDADVCVSSSGTSQVLRYQEGTGTFLGICASGGGLIGAQGVAFGPDGNLYVSAFDMNVVLRYNGATGAFIDIFASGGGLTNGTGLTFGPDGNLYVNNYYARNVLRYNGTTGAFMNAFAIVPGGNPTGLTFGPDGNLYVSNGFGNQVVRFNGTTGAFMGVFASGGGLSGSEGVTFGPDGNLYVASTFTNNILRYNGTTGAFMNVFASGGLNQPTAVVFRPDGNLYVTSSASGPNAVVRFNGTTGASVDVFIPTGSGGMSAPIFMAFTPTPSNQTPSANAGPNQAVQATSPSGAVVRLDGTASSDPDGDTLKYTWTGPFGTLTGAVITPTLPLGVNTITLTVDDGRGGTSSSQVVVTVQDTTPPTLSVSLTPNVITPADHRMVDITATIQVSDTADPSPRVTLVSITSSEADSGVGAGDVAGDMQGAAFGTDDRAFSLRAEGYATGIRRTYTVTYRATDASGNSSTASAQVTVPNTPPIANAGGNPTIECTGPNGATVTLNGSTSSDPDGDPLTFTWTGPFGTLTGATITPTLAQGTHTITLTVNDGKGGTASATVQVTVRDTTAPTLSVLLTPTQLWPPDHRPVTITANIQVSDTCDSGPTIELVSITSNEPDAGLGDGDLANDIQLASFSTDDRSFSLRAERSWTGTGRLYTATYRARDSRGNVVVQTAQVSVPLGMAVTIDIQPGGFPNNINLAAPGFVPVAILTTSSFNAATVAVNSVSFAGAAPAGSALADVDADGDIDLILRFRTLDLQLDCTSTVVRLTGLTMNGTPIQGTDSVRIIRDRNGQLCR